LSVDQKEEILTMVDWAKSKGVSESRSCLLLMISRRRVSRWRMRRNEGQGLRNGKPGPRYPLHRLLPQERQAIVAMAIHEDFADLSHRTMAVTAWDRGLFYASFSSVYRTLCEAGLMAFRGPHCGHNSHSIAPARREITGPNQRWSWDISYLPTFEKGLFLYLYLLLDEYSRKIIHWLISWHQRAREACHLIEQGLISENILDLPEDQRPEVINDRGSQMKAKSIRKLFEDHRMPQLFARPRTPNDNPFVESLFGTVKTDHRYPGRFRDLEASCQYFDPYFEWYNTKHLHSGIDYVTPEQCHSGLRPAIVAARKERLKNQREVRKEVNGRGLIIVNRSIEKKVSANHELSPCSVMNP